MGGTPAPDADPPVIQGREFWALIGYAAALGVFGAFAGLVFLGIIKLGSQWSTDSNPGWFGGHWWWVAVTAAAGIVVGLLRRLTRLPEDVPGLFDDVRAGHVDPRLVPGTVAVSAVSLIGGATVGPEKVLASMAGGVGSWVAQRRGLCKKDSGGRLMSFGMALTKQFSRSPAKGAETLVWLAESPDLAGKSGGYFFDLKPREIPEGARDPVREAGCGRSARPKCTPECERTWRLGDRPDGRRPLRAAVRGTRLVRRLRATPRGAIRPRVYPRKARFVDSAGGCGPNGFGT